DVPRRNRGLAWGAGAGQALRREPDRPTCRHRDAPARAASGAGGGVGRKIRGQSAHDLPRRGGAGRGRRADPGRGGRGLFVVARVSPAAGHADGRGGGRAAGGRGVGAAVHGRVDVGGLGRGARQVARGVAAGAARSSGAVGARRGGGGAGRGRVVAGGARAADVFGAGAAGGGAAARARAELPRAWSGGGNASPGRAARRGVLRGGLVSGGVVPAAGRPAAFPGGSHEKTGVVGRAFRGAVGVFVGGASGGLRR